MEDFCEDFKTIVTLQAPLSVRSMYSSSSSSSVGNFSVDSHSYSEGRKVKAPLITIGFLDNDVKTTANTIESQSDSSMNFSLSSHDVGKLKKSSTPIISISTAEETKERAK